MCVRKDKGYSIVRKELSVSCFYFLVFSCLGSSWTQFYRDVEHTFQSKMYND